MRPSLAITSLAPDGEFILQDEDYSTIEWVIVPATIPTQAEIDAEVIRLKEVDIAQEYARKRKAEYPDWGTQLNKIYDDGVTKWKSEMVDPIKAKWPKDNSGPV